MGTMITAYSIFGQEYMPIMADYLHSPIVLRHKMYQGIVKGGDFDNSAHQLDVV